MLEHRSIDEVLEGAKDAVRQYKDYDAMDTKCFIIGYVSQAYWALHSDYIKLVKAYESGGKMQ